MIRFSDGFYTGAIPQASEVQPRTPTNYGQPNYNPDIDRGTTGSIAAEPVERVALPKPSESHLANPKPAGAVATYGAPAGTAPMTTASIAPAEPAPARFGGEAGPVRQSAPARASTPEAPVEALGSRAPAPRKRPDVKSAPARAAVVADGGHYTVAPGDTLFGISRRTGASVEAIKQVNSMSSDTVRIGQTLIIPGLATTENEKVASAKKVDPIKTSKVNAPEETAKPVTGYTPPKQSVTTTEGSITKIETRATAKAPETTGINAMRWPVQGRVISAFGSDIGGKANDGIDISVPTGTPVKVAENGVVIYAGDGLKELGKTILVRHSDGIVTVYGHVSDIDVKRGDTVKRGQQIAASGMSGSAKQPQLHFEVRKNSKPVDPVKYLQ
ncbi:MAG: hypothetical protein Kow0026_08010 [Oricola sp.]